VVNKLFVEEEEMAVTFFVVEAAAVAFLNCVTPHIVASIALGCVGIFDPKPAVLLAACFTPCLTTLAYVEYGRRLGQKLEDSAFLGAFTGGVVYYLVLSRLL